MTILLLVDEAKCFIEVRKLRWLEGVKCPHCKGESVSNRGFDDTQKHRQRYHCAACHRDFDDLTGTVLAEHHQPLSVWKMCLYFMGLNLSNALIAEELELDPNNVQDTTIALCEGIEASGRWRFTRTTDFESVEHKLRRTRSPS